MSTPDSDEEMIRLRAEFPGHRIGTETIMDRVRYVARSQQSILRRMTTSECWVIR